MKPVELIIALTESGYKKQNCYYKKKNVYFTLCHSNFLYEVEKKGYIYRVIRIKYSECEIVKIESGYLLKVIADDIKLEVKI